MVVGGRGSFGVGREEVERGIREATRLGLDDQAGVTEKGFHTAGTGVEDRGEGGGLSIRHELWQQLFTGSAWSAAIATNDKMLASFPPPVSAALA